MARPHFNPILYATFHVRLSAGAAEGLGAFAAMLYQTNGCEGARM